MIMILPIMNYKTNIVEKTHVEANLMTWYGTPDICNHDEDECAAYWDNYCKGTEKKGMPCFKKKSKKSKTEADSMTWHIKNFDFNIDYLKNELELTVSLNQSVNMIPARYANSKKVAEKLKELEKWCDDFENLEHSPVDQLGDLGCGY